jgi:hypothetical protein
MTKNFQPIDDAYELSEGSIVKGKDQEELFQLGEYDADKKGYTAYAYENGERFGDFSVLITESELMDNYLLQSRGEEESQGEKAAEDDKLSDAL